MKKLQWNMVAMLLAGWLLPLMLIAFILLYFVSAMLNRQIENTVVQSADKAVEICEIQLAEAVSASKNASYISTVRDSYQQYLVDGKTQILYKNITNFLNQHYRYDENFICTMLFFLDQPEQIYYATNTYQESNSLMGGYSGIQFFKENNFAEVNELAKLLDTEVELVFLKERLYLVRNIVDTYYRPYAMIIIELDPDKAFASLDSVWGAIGREVYLDGEPLLKGGAGENFAVERYEDNIGESSYVRNSRDAFAYKNVKFGKNKLTFLAALDTKAIVDETAMVRYLFILIILFLIPLLGMIIHFFHSKISQPVARLIAASQKIQEGDYGFQITEPGKSEEFTFLIEAYNSMSKALHHQFQQIYLEELALRDANIMALQSQINPHFLNNTLEIINWEARMNGNDKVSGMIESLGTMLSFTTNRRQLHFHSLADEMTYVDAYLYIISKRFENRFLAEKEIDEKLLCFEVPRLIIQPVVENAVEHGMKGKKTGKVFIRVYGQQRDLFIQIINDRHLEEREKARIKVLLDGEPDQNEERISLGIRNVNERLKIIYGDNSGLSIDSDEEGNTVSSIQIRMGEDFIAATGKE